MHAVTSLKAVATVEVFLSRSGQFTWRSLAAGGIAVLALLVWHEATGAFECFTNAGDEGMEVNKAICVAAGHRLYADVWNDQPPLYTLALSGLCRGTEPSMAQLRRGTFLFTAVLLLGVSALGPTLGLSWLEVACAEGFLLASPWFLPCSASTTLEIPALAMGVIGAWLLIVALRRDSAGIGILAGGVLGIGVMIKATALSVLPLVIGFAALRWAGGKQSHFLRTVGIALVSSVAAAQVVWWVASGGASWRHLLGTHFGGYPMLDAEASAAHRFHWSWLWWQPCFAGAAVVGLGSLLASSSVWAGALLGLWAGGVLLVFGAHFPWWDYYSLHARVPLALLAGVGLAWALRWIVGEGRGGLVRGSVNLLLGVGVGACVWEWAEAFAAEAGRVRAVGRWQDHPVVRCVREEVGARGDRGRSLLQLTSGPYAVHCGLEPLPRYAVLPHKRRWTGQLTNEELAAQVRARRADVLIAPPLEAIPAVLADEMQRSYRRLGEWEDASVWLATER